MKKKQLWGGAIALLLAGATFLPAAFAQQPAEESYRAMLAGDYDLQYTSSKHPGKGFAIDNKAGARAVYTGTKGKKGYIWHYDAYVKDGNLYRFEDSGEVRVARVLPLADLSDPYLDPDEDWPGVREKLALPEAFAPLCWGDKWTTRPASLRPPVFAGSDTVTEGEVSYARDTYTSDIMTQAGTVSGQLVYHLLYGGDTLKKIEKALRVSGEEQPVETITLLEAHKLSAEASIEPKNMKIYGANRGDIADITGNPPLVGEFAAPKEEKEDAK